MSRVTPTSERERGVRPTIRVDTDGGSLDGRRVPADADGDPRDRAAVTGDPSP
ncbi:hypothetical protein ACFQPA_15395 [Halomarina halobia]|uniref:Uncharacterized protein n=1 Tax=Halomarina halobia TaxID=3033386 RepID=A0ABD6A8C1_9EURY|nr:hypothetical protein [Halomarina sp. PSR21]